MTYTEIARLYDSYIKKEYVNNPELAEEIKKTINLVRSLGSTKNGINEWVGEICSSVGAITNAEKYIVIDFMTINTNILRLEYDDEYAEMQCGL